YRWTGGGARALDAAGTGASAAAGGDPTAPASHDSGLPRRAAADHPLFCDCVRAGVLCRQPAWSRRRRGGVVWGSIGDDRMLPPNTRGGHMAPTVETSTPPNTPTPIGPYNHIAKVGQFISIGGTAGFNPTTGELAGPDIFAQTWQILESFKIMLEL